MVSIIFSSLRFGAPFYHSDLENLGIDIGVVSGCASILCYFVTKQLLEGMEDSGIPSWCSSEGFSSIGEGENVAGILSSPTPTLSESIGEDEAELTSLWKPS